MLEELKHIINGTGGNGRSRHSPSQIVGTKSKLKEWQKYIKY
jgi:hypothetical protein